MSHRIAAVQTSHQVVAFIAFLAAMPVHADRLSDTLKEISQCSGIADPAERLRCYDTVAPRAREILAPSVQDFGKPPAAPPATQLSQVTAVVRELQKTARGRAVFVLDNGQTWRQLDADSAMVQDPDPGRVLKVTISEGMFGSYNLAIDGRKGIVKVRRVE